MAVQINGCGTESETFRDKGNDGGLGGEKGDAALMPDVLPFDGDIPLSGFDTIQCSGDKRYELVGLASATASDYVDLREQHRREWDAGADYIGPVEIVGADGEACKTASDRAACTRKLDAVTGQGGFVTSQSFVGANYNVLARTRGDDVTVFRSRAELAAFLGSVDIRTKALLHVLAEPYSIACNEPGVRPVADGYEVIATKVVNDCPFVTMRYLLHVARNGDIRVLRQEEASRSNGCAGRRPEGLAPAESDGAASATARYFADVAYLEAASIRAFETLERELALHGAPRSLQRRAARAARDEVRHARMTSRIARRFGAANTARPRAAPPSARALEAIALENAVEGCLRETYGALIATYQAEHATDSRIAAAMRIIARDETRHAALAWDVAAWLEPRLSPEARARIASARAEAVHELLREAVRPVENELQVIAGHPSAAESARLGAELARALWT